MGKFIAMDPKYVSKEGTILLEKCEADSSAIVNIRKRESGSKNFRIVWTIATKLASIK